jgi:hypothetical protein
LLGYTLALIAVTWPLAVRFGHATYGGPGDGWALIWQTRFRFEHGISYFSPTHSADVAWPVGTDDVSSVLLSNAAIELPTFLLLLLGVGDVAAYNIVDLAGGLGASLAMYVLLRRLECRASVAFWGGLAYLLAPWHLVKLGIHPTLASTACFPLLLLGIHDWSRSYRLRAGLIVVGAFGLAAYTHSYHGLAAGLLLAVALPLLLVRAHAQGLIRRAVGRTAMLACALLIVLVPLGAALLAQSPGVTSQLDRPLYLIEFAARPYLWVLPHPDNPVFGEASRSYVVDHGLRANEGELSLYLGLLTIALGLAGLLVVSRRGPRFDGALAFVTALLGVALSAPGEVSIPLDGTVRAPISFVNDVVGFVSTPARFFVLTLTGMVVLAALGLEWLARRIPPRFVLLAVGAACLISALELPIRREGMIVDTGSPALVAAIERTVPDHAPIAQYPSLSRGFLLTANQLFYQLDHGHPLLAGADASSTVEGLRESSEDPSDPATPRKLALYGYAWATYDVSQAAAAGISLASAQGYKPPPGFRVVRRLADGSTIMRVVARPVEAVAGLGAGFTRGDRWLSDQEGTIAACATRHARYTLKFTAAEFGGARTLRIGDSAPFVVVGEGKEYRVPLTLRSGWQSLRIELIGSKPTRPSEVIPGYGDDRTLSVRFGRLTVSGPTGPPEPCRRGPLRAT